MGNVLFRTKCFFFFFQAEDGIRDVAVTGVQTCALPISREGRLRWCSQVGYGDGDSAPTPTLWAKASILAANHIPWSGYSIPLSRPIRLRIYIFHSKQIRIALTRRTTCAQQHV